MTIAALLTAALAAATPAPPEDLTAADLQVEAVARDFRIAAYESSRMNRARYDELRQAADDMLNAWYDADTPASHREAVIAWFEEAALVTFDGRAAALPERPELPEPLDVEAVLEALGETPAIADETGEVEIESDEVDEIESDETDIGEVETLLPALAPPAVEPEVEVKKADDSSSDASVDKSADEKKGASTKPQSQNSVLSSLRAVVGRVFAILG